MISNFFYINFKDSIIINTYRAPFIQIYDEKAQTCNIVTKEHLEKKGNV